MFFLLFVVWPQCLFCESQKNNNSLSAYLIFQKSLSRNIDELESTLSDPTHHWAIRDLSNGALAVFVLNRNSNEAVSLLQKIFDYQDMNLNSPNFGILPWYLDASTIQDGNCIDFGTQAWGPILIQFGNKRPPGFKAKMLLISEAAIKALQRHQVPVSYTNIYLMNAINLLLLGQATGDEAGYEQGVNQLNTWFDYTKKAGLSEYDSPTYCATDLNSLMAAYLNIGSLKFKKTFNSILDYFWTDLCANYFSPGVSLSGSHARVYNFLDGQAQILNYYFLEGLSSSYLTTDFETTFALLGGFPGAYHPDKSITDLAKIQERTVLQTWGTDNCQDKINFLTPGFSIGSSAADYGLQDKIVNIELKTEKPKFPEFAIFSDLDNKPYNLFKVVYKNGYSNTGHFPYYPTVLQDKGNLLVLLDQDGTQMPMTKSFATNLLIPAKADEIVLDAQKVQPLTPFVMKLQKDSVLGIREGNSGVAVRIFDASACAGQNAEEVLQADDEGLKNGVARLTVYHYQGDSKQLEDAHLRVGLLILVSSCADEASFLALMEKAKNTSIHQNQDDEKWEVQANVDGDDLLVGHDFESRRTLYRRINGRDFQPHRLSVNGQDLMKDF
jgi:hypothetical protein